MKKTRKLILSSLATIAVCASLIVGSTFALFTSESKTNIAVTSGKVNVVATFQNFNAYSVTEDPNGDLTVAEGLGAGKYSYKAVNADGLFDNGGAWELSTNALTLERVTPGDKVDFTLQMKNNSNVDIQYRLKINVSTEGYPLMRGLILSMDGTEYEELAYYTGAWVYDRIANHTDDMQDIAFSIWMPVTAGNEYQDLKDLSITFTVEAIQANGITDRNPTNYSKISELAAVVNGQAFDNMSDALAAAQDGDTITLFSDTSNTQLTLARDVTIDLNGKNLTGTIAAENGKTVTLTSNTNDPIALTREPNPQRPDMPAAGPAITSTGKLALENISLKSTNVTLGSSLIQMNNNDSVETTLNNGTTLEVNNQSGTGIEICRGTIVLNNGSKINASLAGTRCIYVIGWGTVNIYLNGSDVLECVNGAYGILLSSENRNTNIYVNSQADYEKYYAMTACEANQSTVHWFINGVEVA